MSDELRNCCDCGAEFTITEGEVEFYSSKGMQLPRRCKECRAKRKAQKNGGRPPRRQQEQSPEL